MAGCYFLPKLGQSSSSVLCQVTKSPSRAGACISGALSSCFHSSPANFDARVPNPQKRLQRPTLVNPQQMDRVGNPLFRQRADTAVNRCDQDLLSPIAKWELRNRIVYPPMEEVKKYYEDREEECPRLQPPFVVHSRQQIRGNPKQLNYAAYMIMGMNVDDAIDQLDLHPFEECTELKETILEAVDLAINQHGMEFRSNMYVAYSKAVKGKYFFGVRKRMGSNFQKTKYKYTNYIVCLVEGEAPKDFFPVDHQDCNWKLENRLKQLRAREINWDFQLDRPTWGTKRC